MGGCASKPKGLENLPDSDPAEAPAASPEKTEQPEADADVQEKVNGGEKQNENEAPLVDDSEPKKEEAEESSNTKDANGETAENKTEKAKVTVEGTEKKVEAAAVNVETKADHSDVPKSTSSETEKTDTPLVSV